MPSALLGMAYVQVWHATPVPEHRFVGWLPLSVPRNELMMTKCEWRVSEFCEFLSQQENMRLFFFFLINIGVEVYLQISFQNPT